MLSHQPEVSRLLQQEHVQRLVDDAQQPMASLRLSPPSRLRRLSPLPRLSHAVLDARHRRLPTRG